MEKSSYIIKFQNKLLKLNDGHTIPAIGFGTYGIKAKADIFSSLQVALATGYRHIDTAQIYRNEHFIGEFLADKQNEFPRKDLFITSKIHTKNMNYEKAKLSIDESLKNLKTDYIDLMLIHWPEAKTLDDRIGVWRALEEGVETNKIRSIGVSNFLPLHLNSILKNCKIIPCVNQIEIHPLFIDWETINLCKENNILLQAYCPIGRMDPKIVGNDLIKNLAQKYHKQATQILIRWSLQNDFCSLIKSIHEDRIKENFDVDDFQLEEEEFQEITKLNCNYKISWDPRRVNQF